MNQILSLLVILSCTSGFVFAQDTLMIGGEPCGPHGNAKAKQEYDQNVFKNRFTFPKTKDFDNSITLEKIVSGGQDRDRFTQGKAAELVGYISEVKYGGIET